MKKKPTLQEFQSYSYEDKEMHLEVNSSDYNRIPPEFFFVLPYSLKKKYIGLRLLLNEDSYKYITQHHDLNKYRIKVAKDFLEKPTLDFLEEGLIYYFYDIDFSTVKVSKKAYELLMETDLAEKVIRETTLTEHLSHEEILEILSKTPNPYPIVSQGLLDISYFNSEEILELLSSRRYGYTNELNNYSLTHEDEKFVDFIFNEHYEKIASFSKEQVLRLFISRNLYAIKKFINLFPNLVKMLGSEDIKSIKNWSVLSDIIFKLIRKLVRVKY